MDLNLTSNEQQFRDEFRAWLAANTPPEWTGDTNAEDRADYLKYLRGWQRQTLQRRLGRHFLAAAIWWAGRGADGAGYFSGRVSPRQRPATDRHDWSFVG